LKMCQNSSSDDVRSIFKSGNTCSYLSSVQVKLQAFLILAHVNVVGQPHVPGPLLPNKYVSVPTQWEDWRIPEPFLSSLAGKSSSLHRESNLHFQSVATHFIG